MDPEATALELAAQLRNGRATSEELVARSLARIEERNPELSAFVQVARRRALSQAKRWDRLREDGEPVPVFAGVPIAIKDLEMVRGMFNRVGSRAMRYLLAPTDGPITRRLRSAGFVIVGKTSTSELAILPMVETDIHPPTRNPWSPGHTAGGSSGGSAAAVAAGMLPVAHATDGAGSIRIPASFCNLVGFKASRDLLPSHNKVDYLGLSATGCVSLDMADTIAVHDVYQGRVRTLDGCGSLTHRCSRAPTRKRIRLLVESPLCDVDPHIASRVREIADALVELGHQIVPGSPLDIEVEEFKPLMEKQSSRVPIISERLLQPLTRSLRARGRDYSEAETSERAARLRAQVIDWFGDADLWLMPTTPVLPPRVGELGDPDPERAFRKAANLGVFTAAFNVSGQPALTIPAGFASDGRPFGAMLAGRRGDDLSVLRVGRQLESVLRWRRPAASFASE